jgi:hypothetical protein
MPLKRALARTMALAFLRLRQNHWEIKGKKKEVDLLSECVPYSVAAGSIPARGPIQDV